MRANTPATDSVGVSIELHGPVAVITLLGTHAAGRILGLDAPEDLNADDFEVDYSAWMADPLASAAIVDEQPARVALVARAE